MSPSFPQSWEKLDPTSVDLLGSQSGHDGGYGSSKYAPRLNQSGGVELACDKSTVGDGKSRKAHIANRVEYSPLKIGLVS